MQGGFLMKHNKCCCISGECLNAVTIAAANTIAKNLSINELSMLSIALIVLADALAVIAETRSICCECLENETPIPETDVLDIG